MNRSEQIHELAAALAKAQSAIQTAKKDKANPFFKSKYADLASVWEACRGPLTANGLSVVQVPELADGRVTVTTTLLHASGQFIDAPLSAPLKESTAQAIGSLITYLRRYSLSAMAGVAPDEDDDAEKAMGRGNGHGNGAPAPEVSAEDRAKTVADWKKEIDTAPEFSALEKVGVRLRAAIDAGCLTQDQALELSPAFQGKRKAFQAKPQARQ